MNNEQIAAQLIAMEKAALEEWNRGNPDGYLDIYASDVTYFDPYLEKRIDGFDAIKSLYDNIRGQVSVTSYEFMNPNVQVAGNTAILTFNLISKDGDKTYPWNCTEVYRQEADDDWKIAHVHWSYIRPMDRMGDI